MNNTRPAPTNPGRIMRSFPFKMTSVGFLIMLLLIPLVMINNLVSERQQRESEAKHGIARMWGPYLTIGGPVLLVPYTDYYVSQQTDSKGQTQTITRAVTRHAWSFPKSTRVTINTALEERHRGIYKANIYNAAAEYAGEFTIPKFEGLKIPSERFRWDEAMLVMSLPAGKSVRGEPVLNWNGKDIPLKPTAKWAGVPCFHLRADLAGIKSLRDKTPIPFRFSLPLRGTESLLFYPSAVDFAVKLKANWPHPSFQGSTLPFEHKITDKEFSASWNESIRDYNVSQEGADFDLNTFGGLYSYSFGVDFFDSVDRYHQTERAIKYGVLFIMLTFMAFFLFEIRSKLHVHPFQYLLVGCANSIFYLLLLSLSEHVHFHLAYLMAAVSVVLMIGLYARSVLKQSSRSTILSVALTILYVYLFFLLIEQDYALLFGSVGLFACLGLVMFLTRNIDWYGIGQLQPQQDSAPDTQLQGGSGK